MGEVVSILGFLPSDDIDSSKNEMLIAGFQRLVDCWEADGVDSYFDKSGEVVALSRNIIEMLQLSKTNPSEAVIVRKLAKQVAIVIDNYSSSVCVLGKNR
ncbi:hypothetical protein [Roseibium album]|uniref:hypothetical protein n=1 Tax=Roseibium album TaxID=311410 RepID=UPI0024919155|nr:hypothetical protein [Roseibium album]MCR9059455.1 hypothetical protein [Paracoccaceae bacterium]